MSLSVSKLLQSSSSYELGNQQLNVDIFKIVRFEADKQKSQEHKSSVSKTAPNWYNSDRNADMQLPLFLGFAISTMAINTEKKFIFELLNENS
jgi:hypothetical protein